MKIVEDENKRLADLDKRGIDFCDLHTDFSCRRAARCETGRFTTIGQHGEAVITVIFQPLGRKDCRSSP